MTRGNSQQQQILPLTSRKNMFDSGTAEESNKSDFVDPCSPPREELDRCEMDRYEPLLKFETDSTIPSV